MAGWCIGAHMKPTPASATQRAITGNGTSSLTPSVESTSDAPDMEETRRLPCLAIADAGTGSDERRAGRDIVRAVRVAARADDIDRTRRDLDAVHSVAHHLGRASDLLDRLAAYPQRHKECAHLRGVAAPAVIWSSAVRISS